MTSSTRYRLIIDTNSYSGNFERESVAYAIGLVGECEVGEEQAELAHEALDKDTLTWWEEHVIHDVDEHGVSRPAAIYPFPGMFNNGLGGHFPRTDEGREQALVAYKKAGVDYEVKQLKALDSVVVGQHNWTEEALTSARERHNAKIAEIEATTQVREYDAYQSVAVMVDEMPSDARLSQFRARMTEYLATQKVEVLGLSVETEVIDRKLSRRNIP